jgi:hypothetical protein
MIILIIVLRLVCLMHVRHGGTSLNTVILLYTTYQVFFNVPLNFKSLQCRVLIFQLVSLYHLIFFVNFLEGLAIGWPRPNPLLLLFLLFFPSSSFSLWPWRWPNHLLWPLEVAQPSPRAKTNTFFFSL